MASGTYDADIRCGRGAFFAAYARPVIATFHHEPSNDGGDPAQPAASWAALVTHVCTNLFDSRSTTTVGTALQKRYEP